MINTRKKNEAPRSKLCGILGIFSFSPSPASSPTRGEESKVTPQQAAMKHLIDNEVQHG
jgi:hypothetical protein